MIKILDSPRSKTQTKQTNSPHWHSRQQLTPLAELCQQYQPTKQTAQTAVVEPPKQLKQAEVKPAAKPQPKYSQQQAAIFLYGLMRDALVKDHDESLLQPIAESVEIARSVGVTVVAVREMPSALWFARGGRYGSFMARLPGKFDIWIDWSATQAIAAEIGISTKDCAELSLWHELAHFTDSSESGAWNGAYRLWQNYGSASEVSFWRLRHWGMQSHGLES